jgi:hypothetical protein
VRPAPGHDLPLVCAQSSDSCRTQLRSNFSALPCRICLPYSQSFESFGSIEDWQKRAALVGRHRERRHLALTSTKRDCAPPRAMARVIRTQTSWHGPPSPARCAPFPPPHYACPSASVHGAGRFTPSSSGDWGGGCRGRGLGSCLQLLMQCGWSTRGWRRSGSTTTAPTRTESIWWGRTRVARAPLGRDQESKHTMKGGEAKSTPHATDTDSCP